MLLDISSVCHLYESFEFLSNVTHHEKRVIQTYADSVAPDKTEHPDLILELRCPLFYIIWYHRFISGQCSSKIRLRVSYTVSIYSNVVFRVTRNNFSQPVY